MDTRIESALAQMEQGLGTPLSIATLAAGVNLSPSRFAHLFYREVGTSPARYLHALRMLRARLLLERTFLSVKEVMALVGCNDPSHFSRDFRRIHGVEPAHVPPRRQPRQPRRDGRRRDERNGCAGSSSRQQTP